LQRLKARIRFKSILARIIFLHVIAVAIICALMPLLLYWLLVRETDRLQQVAMHEHAEMLAAHLKPDSDGKWTLDLPQNTRDLYSETYGRYAYAIADESGRPLFSSLHNRELIFPQTGDQSNAAAQQATRGDAVLSGISESKEIDGKPILIQVAENLRHRDVIIDDIAENFLWRVGWITLPILLVLLLIDILIFRGALTPLTRASRQAQRISPSQTDVRLPTHGMPSEVLILVQAVNKALDRLEGGYRAQREFTADAAHELRTPLAILRTRIDTHAETSLTGAVRNDVEHMGRVVNQLLDMAELDTSVIEPSEEINLQSLCADVVEYIAPLALREGKEVALTNCEEPVWVRGDREMLFRALRNLTENAINHSPQNSTVELVVESSGTVRVIDQGAGVRDEDKERIFQRFWRGDRRRSGSVGLGLSIVERIAQAHGATVAVLNNPGGGAQFALRLSPVRRGRAEIEPMDPDRRETDQKDQPEFRF
jgi:signal transduction histidine kinase